MKPWTNSKRDEEVYGMPGRAPERAAVPQDTSIDRRSPVLTCDEAATWLRLDDGADRTTARRRVQKLHREGRLSALKIGARLLFTVAELAAFVERESTGPDQRSDCQP